MNIERGKKKKKVHLTLMGFWMSGNEVKFGRACFFTEGDVSKRLRFIVFRKVVYNHLNIKHNI